MSKWTYEVSYNCVPGPHCCCAAHLLNNNYNYNNNNILIIFQNEYKNKYYKGG